MNENLTRSDFRLLIVEDSEDDALLLLRELKKGGYRPHWTRVDNPATLDEALAQPWDLAITDHNLPGMDSLEVLHHIQSRQDIPVIVVSGSIGEEVAVETMRRGASDYIMKDNLRRLVPAVARELRESGLRRAHRLAQSALEHLSHHDPLTGLSNRSTFEQTLERVLDEVHASGKASYCAFIDIDHFRLINDTCGHQAGDELLGRVAELLRQHASDGDLLARIGGDEFAWLMADADEQRVLQRLQTLQSEMQAQRFAWNDRALHLALTIGLVPLQGDQALVSEVFTAADLALLHAKEQGRNGIALFSAEDQAIRARRHEMDWATRIDEALDEGRFLIYRQSIRPLGKDTPGRHVEILLRLRERDGSIISPGTFIPAAERYHRMPSIDRWVISRMCEKLAHNECAIEMGPDDLVAINLSGQSLGDDELLPFVRSQFEHHGIPPRRLCFEITETAAISDYQHALAFMKGIKELGCSLALDDFGSGLSSFAYLRNLPVDFLKIDGIFVRNIDHDRMDRTIVEAVHRIAREAGMRTIAEFVERPEILPVLEEIGIDYAQGYAIDEPTSTEH